MVKRALLFAVAALLSVSLGRAETFTIPAGSTIHCRLTETVSTKLNFQGDAFTATVTEPYVVNDRQIIPVGATITGRIADLVRPGRVRGVGEMRLAPEQITFPDGHTMQFSAVLMTAYGADGVKVDSVEGLVKGPSSRMRDIKELGMGMGGGGFVGRLFGGAHGRRRVPARPGSRTRQARAPCLEPRRPRGGGAGRAAAAGRTARRRRLGAFGRVSRRGEQRRGGGTVGEAPPSARSRGPELRLAARLMERCVSLSSSC